MGKIKILLFLLIFISLVDITHAEVVNITASEDTYVNGDAASVNYGTVPNMTCSDSKYSFVKFNVPRSYYAGSAYLHIYAEADSWGTDSVGAYLTSPSRWSENTLNYNNIPSGWDTNFVNSSSVSLGQWSVIDVSSIISYGSNYSFALKEVYGHTTKYTSREGVNAPYLEIHTTTQPIDINWNNKTNNDSKAFLVNTNEVIKFNITAANVESYVWSVNKTNQSATGNEFDFKVPSFNTTYPSTGIWEIRVNGTYTNGSHIVREWMISGLTEDQAPDFVDYFIDQNSSCFMPNYVLDPWGRQFPQYTLEGNYISRGVISGSGSGTDCPTSNFNMNHGTYIYKIKHPIDSSAGAVWEDGMLISDTASGSLGVGIDSGGIHDYCRFGNGSLGGYIPIARDWLGVAPGHHYWKWNDGEWNTFKIIWTEDDWIYVFDNDSVLPRTLGHYDKVFGEPKQIVMYAPWETELDNFEFYNDTYIFPPVNITYGNYSKWWTNDFMTAQCWTAPVDKPGIIADGAGLTPQIIATAINNESLMTYNPQTKTSVIKTNLFLVGASELIINNETVIFDTTNGSLFIRPEIGVNLKILNSTVSTTEDSSLIWNFVSGCSNTIYAPLASRQFTDVGQNEMEVPNRFFKGRLSIKNSTINNTCNLFLDGAHEIILNDTVFSNMSESDFGDYSFVNPDLAWGVQNIECMGNKSLRISPNNDLANFSINNITFKDPKDDISLVITGGEWILPPTTIENSNVSDINIVSKRTKKPESFVNYYHDYENSSIALVNCIYNESKFQNPTNESKIKTKYYADFIVKDPSGTPIQNANIKLIPSNSSFPAENLYKYDDYIHSGWIDADVATNWSSTHIYPQYPSGGSGEGGVNWWQGDPTGQSPQFENQEGGSYKRWYLEHPVGTVLTNENGRTALPNESTNNTIVLTDKVFKNESADNTGTTTSEALTYSTTINATGYNNLTLTGIDPNPTWFRNDTSKSKFTIVATMNDSTDPHLTAFAPAPEYDNYIEGEPVSFQAWANIEPTSVSWKTNGTEVSTSWPSFEMTATRDPVTVTLDGSTANGPLSKTWVLDGVGKPYIGFHANVTTGTYPLRVSFTDDSDEQPTSWAWDFDNDGVTDSTTQNPTVRYNVPGTYTVKLTVSNEAGTNTTTETHYITVTGDYPTRHWIHSIYGYFYNLWYRIWGDA